MHLVWRISKDSIESSCRSEKTTMHIFMGAPLNCSHIHSTDAQTTSKILVLFVAPYIVHKKS
jgi:hypothetical protein